MVAPAPNPAVSSYADRAKKNIRQRPTTYADPPLQSQSQSQSQSSPQKQPPVNVWVKRKEEFAARLKSPVASAAPQLPPSTSSSSENLSQNDPAEPPLDHTDDDDPFVVRTDRAPRLHVPLPSTDSTAEDWPQVGKSITPSSSIETTKPEDSRAESRKGGAPKWVPLPIQAPPDAQPRDPHPSITNRQSTNTSRHSSNYGHGRNSRNHSGRTSANQSAAHSRIHSNAGSTHSSPRHPRSKRLPTEDLNGAPTTRSSRGPSPLPQNFPSFHPADIAAPPSNYGAFLSPPHGQAPYYPQQPPNLPPVASPIYHSPSHPQQPLGLPDPSLPMPPVHGYPYVPYFPGYDYVQAPAPYPYWNGHHSHPASGQQSPAYPLSATPSTYAAALPLHVQQHFYQPPQMQPTHPQLSSTLERGSAGRLSPVTGLDVTTSVPLLDTDSKINGELKRSTSVVFGTIDDTVQPSPTAAEVEPNNNLEKGFKTLSIGVKATDSSIKPRKSNKPIKNGGGEKEDLHHHHHHHAKIVNGDIAVDPLLAKQAESGEARWKFGNAGLVSPAGGSTIDIETKPATEDLSVDSPTGRTMSTVKEGEGEERVETSRSQLPREGGGRGRRGSYIDRGFPRRARGPNGFNRGYNRGFGRGGGSGPHPHGGNSYQQRQGPPSSFGVLPFQGVPSSHPMEGNYYNGPPGTPLATYIPTGYDPYAPPQQQPPPTPVQPFSAPGSVAGLGSPPMPMPTTPIMFPLDSTRYYLLGQLEYYLSPQNMAQDLFLRRHMDSRGWISISLLASFNRVKRLTQDHQLVHEALMYSSLIQVKDDFARMAGWEQFVLPDAPRSMVEGEEIASSLAYVPQFSYPHPHYVHDASAVIPHGEEQQQQQQRWSNSSNSNNINSGGGDGEVEEEVEEEEEEDDVVFVMGEDEAEGKGMWSHEKRT